MRAFLTACVMAVIIAVGAAVILDEFVQEPVSTAFAEPSVRISPSLEVPSGGAGTGEISP